MYIALDTYMQTMEAASAEAAYDRMFVMNGTGAPTPALVRALNLTPHRLSWRDRNGSEANPYTFHLDSDGTIRVEESFEEVLPWGKEYPTARFGCALGRMEYGDPVLALEGGLPLDDGPLVLFVSTLAAGAVARAADEGRLVLPPFSLVLVPDSGATAIRDGQGRIEAVTRFIVAYGDPAATFQHVRERTERYLFSPEASSAG